MTKLQLHQGASGFLLPELLVTIAVTSAISIAIFATMLTVSDVYRQTTQAADLLQRQVQLTRFFSRSMRQIGSVDWATSLDPISTPIVIEFDPSNGSSDLEFIYDTAADQRQRIRIRLEACDGAPGVCAFDDSDYLSLQKSHQVNGDWVDEAPEVLATDIDLFQVTAELKNDDLLATFGEGSRFDEIRLLNINLILRSTLFDDDPTTSFRTEVGTYTFDGSARRKPVAFSVTPRLTL